MTRPLIGETAATVAVSLAMTVDQRAAATEEKASAAGPLISQAVLDRPVWTERRFDALAREGFVMNPVSHFCVTLLATSATAIPLVMMRDDKEVTEHPVLDLLFRPSPRSGQARFLRELFSYHLLAGNAYVEAVGPEGQAPKELWNLRPDRMAIIAGRFGLPKAYEYSVGAQKKRWDVDELNGKSQILHTREFHPLDDWYGLSAIEPAAYGIDRNNAAAAHNKALLDNGARPSGALALEPVKTETGVVMPPADVVEAAAKRLREQHGGPENAGKPFALSGAVKWIEMGLSPKDMDFGEGKADAARDICLAWGVPPVLAVRGESTYNNLETAKLALHEDTVLPLHGAVIGELCWWLSTLYGEEIRLEPDLDQVSALEPRRVEKRRGATELLSAGVITEDEARELLGYGERPKNAVKKIDPSVITSLLDSIDAVGIGPLGRYLRSVGLIDETTTDQQIVDAALAVIEDDDDEDLDDPAAADPNEQEDDDDDEADDAA